MRMKCIYRIIISNLILLLLIGVVALIFFPEIRPSFLDRKPQDPMEVEGYSWEEKEECYTQLPKSKLDAYYSGEDEE